MAWRAIRSIASLAGALLVCVPLWAQPGHSPVNDWQARLADALERLDPSVTARLGVYVRDLASGDMVSFRADQSWYLASMVKVPVAVAVLRGVERGDFALDTRVTLRASDYVDGAGSTNSHPVGTALPIRDLLEQMIIHSDNTASDMLIGLVGVDAVNAVAQGVAPGRFGPITLLADVRRATYGELVPAAQRLAGRDLLVLRQQRSDDERLRYLARVVQVPVAEFRLPTLAEAFGVYYASGLNAGRLDAQGELLTALAEGRLLGPTGTAHLLALMGRVVTGPQRIKAGLPPGARFLHKTGTQRARFCDGGIVELSRGLPQRRAVVVACVRDEVSLVRAERLLREVGTALCRSGLLTEGVTDATSCSVRQPAAGRAAAAP